jgi:uncharacterized membrane protein YkvA (DUF1232 family)
MASNPQPSPNTRPNTLSEIIENVQLAWRLIRDGRVSPWLRFGIPALVGLYFISPIDFLPDAVLGLGQLDDLAIIWLGLQLLLRMASPSIVNEYRNPQQGAAPSSQASSGGNSKASDADVVDASYRVVD